MVDVKSFEKGFETVVLDCQGVNRDSDQVREVDLCDAGVVDEAFLVCADG